MLAEALMKIFWTAAVSLLVAASSIVTAEDVNTSIEDLEIVLERCGELVADPHDPRRRGEVAAKPVDEE